VVRDAARALYWYRRAADQEYAPAQHMVGVLLEREETSDPREAAHWYRKAADAGHTLSQFALALRYDSAHGVERDYEAAHFWYLCAARQGHARAQFNLGVMYAAGQGVRRDLVEAHDWLLRAAAAGIPGAASYLKRITARMSAEQLDMVQDAAGHASQDS
jgi:TPR repeat protein